MTNDCFPPSPIHDPTYKEDVLPQCDPKVKPRPLLLLQDYESNQREEALAFADNLIPLSAKITKEEDQWEDQKEKNNKGDTREEEDREEDRKEDRDKTQAEDSGQKEMRTIIWTILIQALPIKNW